MGSTPVIISSVASDDAVAEGYNGRLGSAGGAPGDVGAGAGQLRIRHSAMAWMARFSARRDTGAVGGDQKDFFVSHAGADRAWAEWVAWQLDQAGYSVELDVWDWAPGRNFVSAMSDALDRCDRVLALFSSAYFDRSRYTTKEWSAAMVHFPGMLEGRLVPVRVEDIPTEQMPSVLRPLISCDVFGMGADQARHVLLAAVAGPQRPHGEPVFPGRAMPGLLGPAPQFPGRTGAHDAEPERLTEADRKARGEAIGAVANGRALTGQLVYDLAQASVEHLERAFGQANDRLNEVTRCLERAADVLEGDPLQLSITPARDAADIVGALLNVIVNEDYVGARRSVLDQADDLTEALDAAHAAIAGR